MSEYKTKSGRVLTDADFEVLAEEAEHGYDVSGLRRDFELRPEPMVRVLVRMPLDLRAAVEDRAASEETSVSEIVREALRTWLDRGGD